MYNRQGRGKVVSSLRCHIVTNDISSAFIIWPAFVPFKAQRTAELNVLKSMYFLHRVYLFVKNNSYPQQPFVSIESIVSFVFVQ